MNKLLSDLPLLLGLLAGLGLTTYVAVAAVVAGTSPLAVPIIIAVGTAGTGIGIWVGWRFRSKIIRRQ